MPNKKSPGSNHKNPDAVAKKASKSSNQSSQHSQNNQSEKSRYGNDDRDKSTSQSQSPDINQTTQRPNDRSDAY